MHTFYSFMEMNEKHLTLGSLFYTQMKTQPSLIEGELSEEQAQPVPSYRVRMTDYSENYQGYSANISCLSGLPAHAVQKCENIWKWLLFIEY